ncbi:MAG: oligosaccharide flippase family protein [bacterium]
MLSQSIYLFLANAAGYGIRIILPIFLVRVLTKEEFGAYSQFFLLETLIQTIFQMGVSQSLYYFVPRDRDNSAAYLLNSVLLNTLIYSGAYILIYLFRDTVAAQTGMQIVITLFWYLAPYSLIMVLNVTVLTYMTATQNIKTASVLTIIREVVAILVAVPVAYIYRDLHAVILALVGARALSLVINILVVHFKIRGFRSKTFFFGIREQVRYGVVLGLAGTVWVYSLRFHELMVSRNYDLETYAIYAAGCKQIPFMQFISQALVAVALGQFAILIKNQDWNAVRELWNRVLGTMYGIGVPLTLLFFVFAKPLVVLMFTPEYVDAVPIFRMNLLAGLGLVLNSTLILRGLNRNDITLKINTGMFLLLPFALYGGMKLAGTLGIISVNVAFLLGSRIVAQTVLNRLVPVHLPYIAPMRSIIQFYGNSFAKLRTAAGKVLSIGRS